MGFAKLPYYNYLTTVKSVVKVRSNTINGFDSLGNFVLDDVLDSTRLLLDTNNFYRTLALKQYELNSHTQNVLATILDRKTPVGTSNITRYTADVVSAELTYPFHSAMPGKTFTAPNTTEYRFGASNGQEKDNEIAKGIFTAEFWEYDSRLGRRWNRDPKPNPAISDYATFSNNSILYADPFGDTLYSRGNTADDLRGMVDLRRGIGELYKDMTPDDLKAYVYKFNEKRYGDKLGPTYEWFKKGGKSDDYIIDSSSRPLGDLKKLGAELYKEFGDEIKPILKKYDML